MANNASPVAAQPNGASAALPVPLMSTATKPDAVEANGFNAADAVHVNSSVAVAAQSNDCSAALPVHEKVSAPTAAEANGESSAEAVPVTLPI